MSDNKKSLLSIMIVMFLILCCSSTYMYAGGFITHKVVCNIYMKDGTTYKGVEITLPKMMQKSITFYQEKQKKKISSSDIDYIEAHHKKVDDTKGFILKYTQFIDEGKVYNPVGLC